MTWAPTDVSVTVDGDARAVYVSLCRPPMAAEPHYSETLALLRLMEERQDEALAIIDEMTRFERETLARHARTLLNMATSRCDGCGRYITEPAGTVTVDAFSSSRRWGHAACLRPEPEHAASSTNGATP